VVPDDAPLSAKTCLSAYLSPNRNLMPLPEAPVLIRHIQPKNFLSFGPDHEGLHLKSLNVIIGPNGSGKSNLIEAIHFMRAASKDFADVTRKGGGVTEWIWKGGSQQPASVSWTVTSKPPQPPLVHHVAFDTTQQRFDLVEETIADEGAMGEGYYSTAFRDGGPRVFRWKDNGDGEWYPASDFSSTQSVLTLLRDPVQYPQLFWLSQNYNQILIYREWSFGRKAVFREPQRADMRNDRLEEDFSNLGLFLNRLKTRFPAAKKKLLEELRSLYDGITDFEVFVEGGTVQVFITEGEFVIPATRLSDGTLRYLCLLAILCDPQPPPLICVEEPELGLHPDILPGLADLLKAASQRCQLIVTTHSDILVDAMTDCPESVIVCEKHNGETEMNRLSAQDMAAWLEKYRLGQLWIDGQLGGKRW